MEKRGNGTKKEGVMDGNSGGKGNDELTCVRSDETESDKSPSPALAGGVP